MSYVKRPLPPFGYQTERLEGGHLLRTNAASFGFLNSNKSHYIELVNNGSVEYRTFLLRAVGFVVFPPTAVYEILQVDTSKTFKFEKLH